MKAWQVDCSIFTDYVVAVFEERLIDLSESKVKFFGHIVLTSEEVKTLVNLFSRMLPASIDDLRLLSEQSLIAFNEYITQRAKTYIYIASKLRKSEVMQHA